MLGIPPAAVILTMLAGPAWAGCDDFSRFRVVICYKGQCEETVTAYSCANIHGAQYGYMNGWHWEVADRGEEAGFNPPQLPLVAACRDDGSTCVRADPSKLTCRAADEYDACWPDYSDTPHDELKS